MAKKKSPHTVVYKKLGKYWGWAYIGENKIELDESLKGYSLLLYMLHEHYHLQHPDWSETKVKKEASASARLLWENNFRWVDL